MRKNDQSLNTTIDRLKKAAESILPHLMDQVKKKELAVHFFVHRTPIPSRGPGRHRFMMSCLLINMETPENLPPFIAARGTALCHRKDHWDPEVGKELSLQRALRGLKQPCITPMGRIASEDLLKALKDYGVHVLNTRGWDFVALAEGCGLGEIKPRGPEVKFMEDLRKPVKEV
jgi:hypothetical protein